MDFLAHGVSEGWLNPFGRFVRDHPALRLVPDLPLRAIITDSLYITEPDVAELLQAKAAIAGGVQTLLELAGLRPEDLRALYVAGGFGYHLNAAHALAIGLFPAIPRERIHLVGNSSLGGASLLLYPEFRSAIEPLLACVNVVELNQIPSFEDNFTDALAFP